MRARERYRCRGPQDLGDVELLALILGTGSAGRSALTIAADLIDRFDGLSGLAKVEPERLALEVAGVGLARAVRVHAAVHAGRRSIHTTTPPDAIHSAERAAAVFSATLSGSPIEELHALYMDRGLRVVALRRLTRGNDGLTVVDPRQVFRPAVELGAANVIMAHNHPSGDPTPSAMDREVTRRVARAGEVLGISLIDHLVIAGEDYCSLAEHGVLQPRVPWPDAPLTGGDRGARRR